eukprot:TCONS_00036912-protein
MAPVDGYIKDLSNPICWKIAEKFDSLEKPNWKTLISKMPKNLYDEKAVLRFHMAILKPRGSPTLALLEDLGRKKKTVGQLIQWLNQVGDSGELISFLERGDQALRELAPTIDRQPESLSCAADDSFELSVEVSGRAPFKYQWFKGNTELRGCDKRALFIEKASMQNGGFYTCRVVNEFDYIYSAWCKVEVAEMPTFVHQSNSIFNTPVITMHPRSAVCYFNQPLELLADAVGDPSPTLQWYFEDQPLVGECSRHLRIESMTQDKEGFYYFEASNKFTSTRSIKAQVTVKKAPLPPSCPQSPEKKTPQSGIRGPEDINTEHGFSIQPPSAPTEKIALVIGNQDYVYSDALGHLVHPVNDAHDISAELRSLNFKVVSLINLNLKDMRNAVKFFCGLLNSGTYALFYFAGHGFEIDGESYMMALDATAKYRPEENLSLTEVIAPLTEKNPKLSVLLVDSCRTQPELCRNDPILNKSNRTALQRKNVTIGYGCCARGRVLESPQMRNGYFALHLLENMSKNVKIDDVMFLVSKGIHEDQIVDPATGRTQVVYRHSTVVNDLRLTDEIQRSNKITDNVVAWQQAHVAPYSPVVALENDHVIVQLIFTPEFSNCLLIQSKVIEKTPCDSPSVVFFLPERIGGANVETISPERKEKGIRLEDKIVRISNIERLEGNIDIHLEIEYESQGFQHQQRAYYCIKEKPLFGRITDQMNNQ